MAGAPLVPPRQASNPTRQPGRSTRRRVRRTAVQQYGTRYAQLRSAAGPQLHASTLPPWCAPGGTLYSDTSSGIKAEAMPAPTGWMKDVDDLRQLWREAGVISDDYRIYCPIPADQTPQADCSNQLEVKDFLEGLDSATLPSDPGPVKRVRVIKREVSSEDEESRAAEFYHEIQQVPNGRIHERWVGNNIKQRFVGSMPLSDYSMTVGMAKKELLLNPGTIVLVASRNTIISKGEVDRFSNSEMEEEQTGELDAASEKYVWHNCAVAAIDFDDGTSTSKRVYVYDPAYPNSRIVDKKTMKTLPEDTRDKGDLPQLADFLMLANANKLIKAWSVRAGWMSAASKSDTNVLIGGGGNLHGLGECRPMSLNFMQQFWTLASELQLAKENANKGIDRKKAIEHRSDIAWQEAHMRLKNAFLHNFEPVRLSSK